MNGLDPPSAHQNGPVLIWIEDHIGAHRPITGWPQTHKEKERASAFLLFFPPSWLLMKSTRFILTVDVHCCDRKGGGLRGSCWMDGMILSRCAKKWQMAESPPRHPGFGTTGKSFLIDNLLRPGCSPSASRTTERPAPKECPQHLPQRPASGFRSGPWTVRHLALETHSFAQAKDVGLSQTHTGQSYLKLTYTTLCYACMYSQLCFADCNIIILTTKSLIVTNCGYVGMANKYCLVSICDLSIPKAELTSTKWLETIAVGNSYKCLKYLNIA